MEIIKQLRKKNGISQSDLAMATGVSLRTIQLYEKKDANIPIKNLTKIAEYFNTSIAELYFYEVKEPHQPYIKHTHLHQGNVLQPLENGKTLLSAPLLLLEAQKTFLENPEDAKLLKGLTYVDFLMDTVGEGLHIAFEILGDSMNDGSAQAISNGNIVLGRKQSTTALAGIEKNLNAPFVVVAKDRILCKSITGVSKEKGTILCHSLNPSPEYRDFEVPISEIVGLYRVVKRQL